MTIIEQRTMEVVAASLPRMAKALERIADALERFCSPTAGRAGAETAEARDANLLQEATR